MKWGEALSKINSRLTEIATYGKGRIELHITPRGDAHISVALLAGENTEWLVEKSSLIIED